MSRGAFLAVCLCVFSLMTATCTEQDSNNDPIGSNSPTDSTQPSDSTIPGDTNNPVDTTTNPDTSLTTWSRTYGTFENDNVRDLAVDLDGNIYVLGTSNSALTVSDLLVIKLDKTGQVIWLKKIDYSVDDLASGIFPQGNAGVLVTGSGVPANSTGHRVIWANLDDDGNLQSVYSLDKPDHFRGVIRTIRAHDDGHILQGNADGSSYFSGPNATFVCRVDRNGNSKWQRYFSGSSCSNSGVSYVGGGSGQGLICDRSSGAITFAWFRLAWLGPGITDCGAPREELMLEQLDNQGNTRWQMLVASYCGARAVAQTATNTIAAVTDCYYPSGYVAYTLEGELATSHTLPLLSYAKIVSMEAVSKGLLLLGSVEGEGLYYGLLDVGGNLIGEATLQDSASAVAAAEAPDGSWIIVGNKPSADSSMQAYVLRVDPL